MKLGAQKSRAIVACVLFVVSVTRGVLTDIPGANAIFTDPAQINEDLDAATIDAPTDLTLSNTAGVATLGWTPPTFARLTAIQVLRGTATGGTNTVVATLAPNITSYSESPGTGTYFYVTRGVSTNWLSPYSNEVNTAYTALSTPWFPCTSQVADTGGDGNGYEVSPASGCGDDNVSADDLNSGTSTSSSCSNSGKDRHRFGNFGVVVPTVATIRGVEVRTQSWLKSATTGTNKVCVQISTDAGVTWTSAISSTTLTATEKVYTLGSSSNLWGRSFLTTQFTNGLFLVRVVDASRAVNKTFALDTVEVRVSYSCPCL